MGITPDGAGVDLTINDFSKDIIRALGNGIGDDGAPVCLPTTDDRGARITYLQAPDGKVVRGERGAEGVQACPK